MSAPMHTPGPWRSEKGSDGFVIVGNPKWRCTRFGVRGEWEIAVIDTDGEDDGANARLITAAPELLDAAEKAIALIDDMARFVGQMALRDYGNFDAAPTALRHAIAKARGTK
jgi:hypothetical protein